MDSSRSWITFALFLLAGAHLVSAQGDPLCKPAVGPAARGFRYAGCYEDSVSNRALKWQWNGFRVMTVGMCVDHCRRFGYPVAGLQSTTDKSQSATTFYAAKNASPTSSAASPATATTSSAAEPLTESLVGYLLAVYVAEDASFAPVFETPKSMGRFEYLFTGPVVPILTALTKTNKVIFLEKGLFPISGGAPNSTHAYEYDYSIKDRRLAFREMNVKTDIFCSAISMIPDQWGRLVNVGGQRDESLSGLRIYRPTGRSGVNATTDWNENVSRLRLQEPRWYPSIVMLRNGSFGVIGGAPNPSAIGQTASVEVVPYNGAKPIRLKILEETYNKNLYPIVYFLPSGKILVVADTRAVLLDPDTFAQLSELKRIPGKADGNAKDHPDGSGGRTYPNIAGAALLPLMPPYQDPAEILICGGSDGGFGEFSTINNCVRTRPDVEGDEWIIERMPTGRVISTVVALPDLTFLIINGAKRGYASWASATHPARTALIYDPFKPQGRRISEVGWTDIARMYHSEAQLVHDGRVLLSGSNPLDARFPDEWRLQFFYPPYLTSGLARPTFEMLPGEGGVQRAFRYGDTIRIRANIPSGDLSAVRASLISTGGNTHSQQYGQRSLGLIITSTGGDSFTLGPLPTSDLVMPLGNYLVYVLDGPTPSEGQWIRVGDEPEQYKNWPTPNVADGFESVPEWTEQ
ncbi:hypothetical protein HDU67_000140 [Dinochytrium kinnereticum]|nr:hypothetical protein HDU67_000140 [Dinochytrium kinnereticum]